MSYHLFTSESVTEGHPDKVCDQISDAVLDAYLEQDPAARVACEAFAHTGCIHLAGQITSTARVDLTNRAANWSARSAWARRRKRTDRSRVTTTSLS